MIVDEDAVDQFLAHYGVKGMKKPTPPKKLERVYRIAAGTANLKANIQKAKKVSDQKEKDKAKELIKAQAQAMVEAQKAGEPDPDRDVDLSVGEDEAKKLLKTCGTMKLADLE